MWYDSLLNSEMFLNLHPGVDDPYSWTIGVGCGYTLGNERQTYTNLTKHSILYNASRDVYFYDEGMIYGTMDQHLMIGDSIPKVGEYSLTNPLTRVGVLQTVYPALTPRHLVERVQNCNRPSGSVDISYDEASEILRQFKEAMEREWTRGWDDPTQSVQFVGLFDDNYVDGTIGRLLKSMTLSNQVPMIISMGILFGISAIASFRFNVVQSRVLVTTIGLTLIIIGYFAGLGLAKLTGIKTNFAMTWTLPFILFGFGVNDLFFIL
jgi:Sterol-sensing domain of SREBP cleavage-activation